MTQPQTTDAVADVTDEQVAAYRRDGFTRVRGVVDPGRLDILREAALQFSKSQQAYKRNQIFTQLVNVWQDDETLRSLTLDATLASIATRLAGVDLRLWHDQVLIKEPGVSAATEFHQDSPYWPHEGTPQALTAWVALVDVPAERGCMTFIPGSHRRNNLRAQNLQDSEDLFRACPDLRWDEKVTVPLRAGDCTFHNGYVGHMANPNRTDVPRVAHAIIYTDAATRYSGMQHPVTDGLGMTAGQGLDDEVFPSLP